MLTSYLVPRLILLAALAVATLLAIRPPKSFSSLALRRLITMLLIICASLAVIFPQSLNRVAHVLGIERGINLLVYGLVIALVIQMATAYRRDHAAQAKITRLARAVALAHVEHPPNTGSVSPSDQ